MAVWIICSIMYCACLNHDFHRYVCVLFTQLCPILCDSMDCRPPGSSVHGILQAVTLEWAAIPFSRGSSQPRDWAQVYCITGRLFTICATKEA